MRILLKGGGFVRRIRYVFLAAFLLFSLALNVHALSAANNMGVYATISNDGSCSVTLTATLRLDQVEETLKLPLPRNAYGITLNGSRARTQVSGDNRMVDLSGMLGGMVGSFSITLNYTLDDVVHTTQTGELELELPLLSGFSHPVEKLDFSVTLPGEVEQKPHFSSGYHQANIEKDITYTISGATITGRATQELKDHETLVMLLAVPETQFPQTTISLPDFDSLNIAMAVSAVLALLYWLLFLRNTFPRPTVQSAGPNGYSAGELGSVLTLKGADLSMMVLSWAKLGYIQLHWAHRARVIIYKRMDMGNERSDFEQRCFRNLFGKQQSIDCSGYRYASLCQQIAKMTPNVQALAHHRSGNIKLFRGLAGLIGMFGGINLGILLSAGAALQWVMVFLLAILGFISSLYLQRWAESLFLRNKEQLWLSLLISAAWLLLSALADLASIGIWVIVAQGIAGLLATYGGRRTEAGRQAISEVLGLRRYLRTLTPAQLQYICRNNPDFFFSLVPEAMALGIDKVFAKYFGKMRLPACPYLTGIDGAQLTATQWSQLLRDVVKAMDARKQQLPLQKLISLLQGFVK